MRPVVAKKDNRMSSNEFDAVETNGKRTRKTLADSLNEKSDSALLQATHALSAIRRYQAKIEEVKALCTEQALALVEADLS